MDAGAIDARTIVGLLADPTRLRVVAALALGAGTLEAVADVCWAERSACETAVEAVCSEGYFPRQK